MTSRAHRRWLERRRGGIGGSDAAAAVGLSPWKSRFTLWCEKTGRLEEPDDIPEYMEWGTILEPALAKRYSQVTGRSLVNPGRHRLRRHPDRDWMHCTIDRAISYPPDSAAAPAPGYAEGDGDLSIKNVGFFKLEEWQDQPPLAYQIQAQHEMAVTGLRWASFAVLIGGQRFHWCDWPRDDGAIRTLIEMEEGFWDLVRRDEPPPADDSDSTAATLARLYPKHEERAIALDAEFVELARRRAILKRAERIVREKMQGIDNRIKAALGDAERGLLPDGGGFSWKTQHRDSYTVPAGDYRVLREIRPPKGKGR